VRVIVERGVTSEEASPPSSERPQRALDLFGVSVVRRANRTPRRLRMPSLAGHQFPIDRAVLAAVRSNDLRLRRRYLVTLARDLMASDIARTRAGSLVPAMSRSTCLASALSASRRCRPDCP